LALCLGLAGIAAHAEETKTGTAVQLSRDTDLRKEPSDDAGSYGVLPSGTVMTLRGQREGDYLAVKVELEDGAIEGWVKREAISRESFDEGDEAPPPPPKKVTRIRRDGEEETGPDEPRLRPRSRIRIPKDEGLLLHRDTTFFYGLHANGSLAIMQDSGGNVYLGPGFSGGAHVGIFLADNIPIRVDVSYTFLSGSLQGSGSTSSTGTGTSGTSGTGGSSGISTGVTAISFGFLDAGLTGQYNIDNFELFGTVQYSYGLGVSNLPNTITIGTAADLSSLWIFGGAGYRIPLNDQTDLSIQARYGVSFLRSPVGFQTISLGVGIDFKG
jgi:hypothetical protein